MFHSVLMSVKTQPPVNLVKHLRPADIGLDPSEYILSATFKYLTYKFALIGVLIHLTISVIIFL